MVWLSTALFAAAAVSPQPFPVQFLQSTTGRTVTICLDGQFVETTFAGKMSFRDANHQWASVCADVRGPVHQGQFFGVRAVKTTLFGGRVALAGNIVAKYFNDAQTPDQCAGLQLAVWKSLEDGWEEADFTSGRLQARASYGVMAWAQYYYKAVSTPGQAMYLQTLNGGNQGAPFAAFGGGAGGGGGLGGGGGAGGGGGGAGAGGGGQSQISPTVN